MDDNTIVDNTLSDNVVDEILNNTTSNTDIIQGGILRNNPDEINDEEEEINQEEIVDTDFSVNADISGYVLNQYIQDNIYYLFLPKVIDISNLDIKYTGNVTEVSSGIINSDDKIITNDFSNNNTIIVTANNNQYTVKVMQTDIASICINLDNDVTLEHVNAHSKDHKYSASVQVFGAKNISNDILEAVAAEFKGRGNSTWMLSKKGYQIKFNKKTNLLGIGNGKSKKWVLLANQVDRTLLRNKIMYDLGLETGLTNIPNSEFVDLFVNGEYIGNYLLSDKIETGSTRVNLSNEKGVLMEMDNFYGESEPLYFRTNRLNTVYAVKESYAGDNDLGNDAERSAMESFQASINQFEDAIYAKASWDTIKSIIDVESFAKLYLDREFSEDRDGYNSSTYFYKDGDDDKIHAGPLWDFDVSLGYHKLEANGGNPNCDYTLKYLPSFYNQLMKYNQFVDLVNKTYNSQIRAQLYKINNKIDSYVMSMHKSVEMNFIKWNNLLGNTNETISTSPNGTDYMSEVRYLKSWITKRIAYMDSRYKTSQIEYNVHVQNIGTMGVVKDCGTAGTTGEGLRMESIRIVAPSEFENAHINYQAHVENIGWMPWVRDGEIAGSEGQGLRMEAIKINIEGIPNYEVRYRVHVQDIGWQDWKYNGEIAGTEGQGLRIEAIEIKVLRRNHLGTQDSLSSTSNVNYSAHIQNIGWSGYGVDGETIGTHDKSYRLEGIKININNESIPDTNIKYQVHVENIGWMPWVKNGELAGTTGQALRLEAIKISLDNKNYTVKYRAYVQDIGWMPWVKNGETAGTTGNSLRIEAIEIKIENNNT